MQPARLLGPNDSAVEHARVPEQDRFYRGRGHPLARHLEEIVLAAAVHVAAVRLPAVDVAGPEPVAHERPARVVEPLPVARGLRGRAHPEHALLALRHRPALRVQDPGGRARHRLARRPGAALAGPVGEHHEDGLGGAEAVEDLHAEPLPPGVVDLGGQPLAGRDAEAHRAEGRRRAARRAAAGRRPSAPRRRSWAGSRASRWRPRPDPARPGADTSLRAGAERDQQRVAEGIGEEELRGREDPVGGGDAEQVQVVAAGRAAMRWQCTAAFGEPVVPEV